MDRDVKLQRLEAFRRSKPHCSASALSQILTDIKQHGVPELTDRISMRQGRDRVASLNTVYRPILKHMQLLDTSGASIDMPFACPFASLTYALAESPNFRKLVKQRLLLNPSTPEHPWTIVLYCDEVTPGNPLATLNKRRFHAFYWSFIELGTAALSNEEC